MGMLYFLAGFQTGYIESVQMVYLFNGFYSSAILGYAFCAASFSACLLEDGGHGYWYLAVQKGNLKSYVRSKLLVCFLSGALTMVFGVLLFAAMLQFHAPLFVETASMADLRQNDTFGFLLYPDTILLYFICSAAVNGTLGGILAAFSAYLSLYEPQRLLTLCAPLAGFYFLENFMIDTLALPECFNVWVVYGAGYSVFGNPLLNLVYGLTVTLLFWKLLETLIYRKVRDEICGITGKTGFWG
ncbi:MAG: hypothetical protein Q4C82_07330 [Eubacteriales bacterium]|nr:hypothetical protein [Eubacteriales bacterium]